VNTSSLQVRSTISGLWALHPLIPIKNARAYEAVRTLCTRLATRDLDAVQEEYFRELKELVEDYEDAHSLLEKNERVLRALAAKV
jgi:hypothetical protein